MKTLKAILLIISIPISLMGVYILFRLAGAGWYKSMKEQLTSKKEDV